MAAKIRVVIAKPGLDGHDRGAKIIARALRDAGMEVIYTGLHQTPEQIVETAIQEDADAVGISILSGAHMTLVPRILELLRAQGAEDVLVVVGGTIPGDDVTELKRQGVAEVFTPGAPTREIVDFLQARVPALTGLHPVERERSRCAGDRLQRGRCRQRPGDDLITGRQRRPRSGPARRASARRFNFLSLRCDGHEVSVSTVERQSVGAVGDDGAGQPEREGGAATGGAATSGCGAFFRNGNGSIALPPSGCISKCRCGCRPFASPESPR